MSLTLTRKPMPGQDALWSDALTAPDDSPRAVDNPAGMEQPSMFAPVIDPPPFEVCDECGLDINQLHHEECGGCYCDGNPCTGDESEED